MDDKIKKWRLILGRESSPQGESFQDEEAEGIDGVLEALYDSDREGGLGSSSPNINRWLGDIRRYFPTPVVQMMQRDALERLGLEQMLLEPELLEAIEPDVDLAATLISLNKVLPDRTRETARLVVQRIVKDIERRLRQPLTEALRGALRRNVRNRRPRYNEIDWQRTIRANLRHYQPDYRTIIPDQLFGFGRKGYQLKQIILLVDQSGSMAASVVYAAVFGSVIASLRSVCTNLVVFDTAVVDLTRMLGDPVDLLFATQLGGGTDINQALRYTQTLLRQPRDAVVVLISDLYEGGRAEDLLRQAASIKATGAQLISLLALNDTGAPAYDHEVAARFAGLDIPAFACTPHQFPALLATAIQRGDIRQWMSREGIRPKN